MIEIKDTIDDIDKNLKFYKEAAWFVNRLIDINTMSKAEIIKVCDTASILAREVREYTALEKLEFDY